MANIRSKNYILEERFHRILKQNFFNPFYSLDLYYLSSVSLNSEFLNVEVIKIQELGFVSEYFLITALFCLILFFVFSVPFFSKDSSSDIKFHYQNQLPSLLILMLFCYLTLVYQQASVSSLSLTSFNDTIRNDLFAFSSKFKIGFISVLYLLFINKYLKDQKLNSFEYYIILFISIFGFFLLCSANDFITAYLAIELQGLAFYVLASFKKSSNFSVESGVKYFVLGSLSTALFLFGITLIYGFSGSIIFSDFKDFFSWIFTMNATFWAFDSCFSFIEFSQEKTSVTTNSEITEIEFFSNKLDALHQNISLLDNNSHVFKANLGYFDLEDSQSLSLIELFYSMPGKLLDFYQENSFNLILSFSSDEKLADVSFFLNSANDFLIENSYKDNSVSFFSAFKGPLVDVHKLITLKSSLIESNYYEDLELESYKVAYDASTHHAEIGKSYLNNVYGLLRGCCYSECFISPLQFEVDSDSPDATEFVFGELVFSGVSLDKVGFNADSQIFFEDSSYFFSLTQIVDLNFFFLEFTERNLETFLFKFDYSLLLAGVLIVALSLFFKLALAPFHLWSPDVYEGSPSSSTFLFMVLSKFGIFVLLMRICYLSFYSLISYWQFFSLFVASTSIFIGAIAGLKQRKLKSLLTYSSINNMGFVLLAFSVGSFEGVQATFYYLLVYMLGSICIWAIILNFIPKIGLKTEKRNRDLGDFALLQESNTVLAQSLGVILFSLAGLPPMVGFLAKMGVFKALSGTSVYYVSVINILFSVLATFYYLRIVKIIFFENILVGYLYETMNSKKVFLIHFFTFLLVFFFFYPMFLYLFSYKLTLYLNKAFF